MMLDTIVGNCATKRNLKDALSSKSLMHSILLCGEGGTGVGYAARCLAADILYPPITDADSSGSVISLQQANGAAQVMANKSGEYLRIEGEGVSGDIKIEAVRSIRRNVFNTSLSAMGRVVHICGAHHLNNSSANALLKVLEEPPEGVVFILTAPSEASVLPTITSRCACYNIAPVSQEECGNYLAEHFAEAENIPNVKTLTKQYSALFGGKIGTCVECLQNEEMRNTLEIAKQLADATQENNTYFALCLLSKYEKERPRAKQLLSMYRAVCSSALRGEFPVPNADKAANALNKAQIAYEQLSKNANQKLVLTCLASEITSVL